MKKVLIFCVVGLLMQWSGSAQSLHVNWTRFIGLDSCCVSLYYATPTCDDGIVFTGRAEAVGSGDIPATPYGGVIVGKMDSNKNLKWVHVYGGYGGYGICETPDGGYAVLASAQSIYGLVTGYHGNGDMWLLRLDSLGDFLWGKCFGSDSFDEEAFSIAATKDNGFILLGASNGAGEDVPFHLGGSEFEMDWFVVKTDSLGNKQWTKDLGGSNDEFWNGHGSIITADTDYYLVGTSNSTDFDCTDNSWHIGVGTSNDVYLLKLDNHGNVLWSKSYGGTGDDQVNNAVLDPSDSSIIITGLTDSHNYMVTDAHGGMDIWTIKVDKNGSLKWAKTLGGPYDDMGTGVAVVPGVGYANLCGTNGVIGRADDWLFILDTLGNVVADTVFGNTGTDGAASVFPYKQGYIATGSSVAPTGFTEGHNFGIMGPGGRCFVSYLSCCPNPAGVLPISNEKQLAVFPNPAGDVLHITLPKKGAITIENSIGQSVLEVQTEKEQLDISVRNLPRGVYMLKWRGEYAEMLVRRIAIN